MNTAAAEDNDKLLLFESVDANKWESIRMNVFELTANETEILLFENHEDVFSVTVVSMLYLLSSDAFHFNSNNVSEFLKCYNDLCDNFHLSDKKKICCLLRYCESQIDLYIKIILKWKDPLTTWECIVKLVSKEFKKNNSEQLLQSHFFLKSFKSKFRQKINDLCLYSQQFSVLFKDVKHCRQLDDFTQDYWFLQELSHKTVKWVMHKCNVNLDNASTVWFDKIRKKVQIICKIKKTAVLLLNTALDWNQTSQLVNSYQVSIIQHSAMNLLQNEISVITASSVVIADDLMKKSSINKLTEMMRTMILLMWIFMNNQQELQNELQARSSLSSQAQSYN